MSEALRHGSLFTGIGGFDLGFERAGIKTVWQVEIDGYCRKVLARHFPDAERFGDIRECGARNLGRVDVLSGGFPCQDISNAGKRAGIDGERSGLWSEYARIIRELRPRYVVVENVAALLGRGMERVLGDLAACGYDAEWQSIRASDVGAPHRRERIWIVAYPFGGRVREQSILGPECGGAPFTFNDCKDVADAIRSGLEGHTGNGSGTCGRQESQRSIGAESLRDATEPRFSDGTILSMGRPRENAELERSDWWATEPGRGSSGFKAIPSDGRRSIRWEGHEYRSWRNPVSFAEPHSVASSSVAA
jgi:site-specific DNA-cytosine methylase